MKLILLGGIAMACFTASLFFLRFWKTTHDRFFLFFSASFGIEGMNRLLQALVPFQDEQEPIIYMIRLFSFVLILIAILDKNRRKSSVSTPRE